LPVDLNILNAKMVSKGQLVEGSISIDEGKIVKLGKEPSLPKSSRRIDVKGHVVLPGMIDCHVHLRDMQLAYKEDFYTGTCAATAGGFTTVFDMPNTKPITDSAQRLKEKMQSAKSKTVVNIGFYSAFPSTYKEFESLAKLGIVGFKAHLQLPWGGLDLNDDNIFKRTVEESSRLGKIVAIHAEDRGMVESAEVLYKGSSKNSFSHYTKVHSEKCEIEAVRRVLRILNGKYRVHFCHVSSPESVNLLKEAKKNHPKLTCEVTPHHLFLDLRKAKRLGGIALTDPPARPGDRCLELWNMLREGLIDIVASDHAPHSLKEKQRSNVWETPPGCPGLETTLPLLLTKVSKGEISLGDVIRVLSQGPADIFQLDTKGDIQPGKDADLVVVDMKQSYRINPAKFQSKAKYSPFEGVEVVGKVDKTFIGGSLTFDCGEITAKPGAGSILQVQ
jgi:dihydroorotase